ncbi:MAG: hypothetical protein ACMZI0_15290 [Symbiopectobacterium sp.]|uniref:hypothetical protein n=1 Tax=Symbiopectobacterium sp. TaxID=2952789 RepID=UPI0039EC6E89
MLSVLEIHHNAVIHPYMVIKLPFYNDTNQCVGVLSYGKILKSFTPNEFISVSGTGSLLLDKPDDFLMLQGKNYKNISDILFLPVNAIENAFQNLYEKANISYHYDFAAFCYQKKYN